MGLLLGGGGYTGMMKKASDYYRFFRFIPEKAGLLLMNVLLAAFEGFWFAELFRRLLAYMLGHNPEGVEHVFFGIAAAGGLYLIFHFLESFFSFRFQRNMLFACQDELFGRYVDSQNGTEGFVSQILTQWTTSLPAFAADTTAFFCTAAKQAFLMVFSCAYIFLANPLILAMGVFLCLTFMALLWKYMDRMTERSWEYMQENDHVYALLKEQVKNRDIAAYMNNEKVTGGLQKAEKSMLFSLLRLKKASNLVEISAVGCSVFLFLAGSVAGGFFVLTGEMTADALAAMLLVIPNLSSGLFAVPGLISKRKQCLGQKKHYEDFLDSECFAPPPTKPRESPKDEAGSFGFLSLRGLSYETPEGKKLLDSIWAEFPCGRFLCLAGASGCGKTTLLNVLGRQYPYKGAKDAVVWGDRALAGIDRDGYWKQFLYIHNRQEILNESIEYNITLSEEPADEARLREALRLADLEKWFEKVGGNFQTVLQKSELSSGERQKFAMARFFYRDCRGGFFDEITSAMDAGSEERVVQNLKKWVQEDPSRFVLFVSHRQGPLEEADCVYYMEAGRIVAKGVHEDLLSCPGYRPFLSKKEVSGDEDVKKGSPFIK